MRKMPKTHQKNGLSLLNDDFAAEERERGGYKGISSFRFRVSAKPVAYTIPTDAVDA
jgi:hypothetical protein